MFGPGSGGAVLVDVKVIEKENHDDLSGRQSQLWVLVDSTVRMVKKQIADKFSIATDEQTILFRGRILDDNQTMQECGIRGIGKEVASLVVVQKRLRQEVSGSHAQIPEDTKRVIFHWDPKRKGSKYQLDTPKLRTWFHHGSWQTIQGDMVFPPDSGKWYWELKFTHVSLKQNSFAAVVGVVPEGPFSSKANQPIGWQKVAGWGLVIGTGQSLHKGGTLEYGQSSSGQSSSGPTFGPFIKKNDVIGVLLDMDHGTIAFFRSGITLDANRRVAQSCLGGWVTVIGDKVFMPGTGVHTWEITLTNIDKEKNVFACVVGVVPANESAITSSNQPIGWKKVDGWGLVVGTGELLHKSTGRSYPGGVPTPEFQSRDRVGVVYDSNRGTISFHRNGLDLGVAFESIRVPIRAALSCIQTQETKLQAPASWEGSSGSRIASPSKSLNASFDDGKNLEFHPQNNQSSSSSSSLVGGGNGIEDINPFSDAAAKSSSSSRRSKREFRWQRPSSNGSDVTVSKDGKETRGGSSSWRTLFGDTIFHPRSGAYEWEVLLTRLYLRSNTFGVVLGVVPASYTQTGSGSNQPVGWKAVPGWSLVSGTGQKLHQSGALPYVQGDGFVRGEKVGVRLDTDAGTLEFFKNGRPLGVAFTGICVAVRPALSCIQNQTTILYSPPVTKLLSGPKQRAVSSPLDNMDRKGEDDDDNDDDDDDDDGDRVLTSVPMLYNNIAISSRNQQREKREPVAGWGWKLVAAGKAAADRNVVLENGARQLVTKASCWHTVVGNTVIQSNTGIHVFEVKLERFRLMSNTFGVVIGVVPRDFHPDPVTNQPIGWKAVQGWGLVAGTGACLHKKIVARRYATRNNSESISFGDDDLDDGDLSTPPFEQGDIIGVVIDTDRNTIEFQRNHQSLGIAFIGVGDEGDSGVAAWNSSSSPSLAIKQQHKSSSKREGYAAYSSSVEGKWGGAEGGGGGGRDKVLSKMLRNKKIILGEEQPTVHPVRIRSKGTSWATTVGAAAMVVAPKDEIEVEEQKSQGGGGGGEGDPFRTPPLTGRGVFEWEIELRSLSTANNTFAVVVGVVSAEFDPLPEVNQPVGWRSARGWALVAGSGMKLHESKSVDYTLPFVTGSRIGIRFDTCAGTLEFLRDGKNLGIAFDGIRVPVYPAISCIQLQEVVASPIRFTPAIGHVSEYGQTKSSFHRGDVVGIRLDTHRGTLHFYKNSQNLGLGYLCPITCELMEDPVVAEDGKTYERAAIAGWLKKSDISPITGQRVKNRDLLIPNQNLKKLILQWSERQERLRKARS
eukprot:jgi/Bigna1/134910/aug1.27_g9618